MKPSKPLFTKEANEHNTKQKEKKKTKTINKNRNKTKPNTTPGNLVTPGENFHCRSSFLFPAQLQGLTGTDAGTRALALAVN